MMDTKPKPKTASDAPEAPQLTDAEYEKEYGEHWCDRWEKPVLGGAYNNCATGEPANAPQTQHTPTPWEIGERVDNPKGMDAFISIHGDPYGVAYA